MYALRMRKGLNPIICAKIFDQFSIQSKGTIFFWQIFQVFKVKNLISTYLHQVFSMTKQKYSSNPKPFALCRNVNGGCRICHNWALGASNHFEKRNASGGWVFPLTLSPWGRERISPKP
jgi:hypothetical protein